MSFPYGQRERFALKWFDASKASKCSLTKGSVEFSGSKKHCSEELIRWLHKKDMIDARDILWLAFKLDFTLFSSFKMDRETVDSINNRPVSTSKG